MCSPKHLHQRDSKLNTYIYEGPGGACHSWNASRNLYYRA
jgi:hypothetical protein